MSARTLTAAFAALTVFTATFGRAQDAATGPLRHALFIGNSYTYGGADPVVNARTGGVPALVAALAAANSRTLAVTMAAVGGKNFAFHRQQPTTLTHLKSSAWDWVVLQGHSLEATRLGDPHAYLEHGEALYRLIRRDAPTALVVLYETWPRAAGHQLYATTVKSGGFADPVQMYSEIQANVAELHRRLEAIEPGSQVKIAPVGHAFTRCARLHPEIELYDADRHHASVLGSYLAALVIYVTIFGDSPPAARPEFPGLSIPGEVARRLQRIAADTLALARRNSITPTR